MAKRLPKKEKEPKVILAFELTEEEIKKYNEVDRLTWEEIDRKKVEKAQEFVKDKKQEDVNDYITANVTKTRLTKPFIAAYIKKFETDTEWIKTFKKESMQETERKVSTVITDANGIVVHKEGKDGKSIPKTTRVKAITGETYMRFSISKARDLFIERYNITTKSSSFVMNQKRTTKKFDAFDIFDI